MQWPKVFRNLGIWPTFFHPFWTIFCQGEPWDHFLGRWRVKIHKFNDFWWLLQQIRIFLTQAGGGDGSKKSEQKQIVFLCQKQQLCVCFCVLAVVAPKTIIFERSNTFHYFRVQKDDFCVKLGAEKLTSGIGHNKGFLDSPQKSDTTKDFWTPGTKMHFKISPPFIFNFGANLSPAQKS